MKKNLKILTAAISDIGRVRAKNEDNLIFHNRILEEDHVGMQCPWTEECPTNRGVLMGVFDGMGGYRNGQRASYLVAEYARRILKEQEMTERKIPVLLKKICLDGNQIVCEEMKQTKEKMGTTAAMLCFYQNSLWVCNVGDSPIFRLRDGKLEKIYQEHTERAFHIELFGEESVKGKKFTLTQNIGIPPEEMIIEPYIKKTEIAKKDVFLIASDGLTDMVAKKDIEILLNQRWSIGEKVIKFKELALKNGGKDNITLIGIEVDER